ncbi:MAG TPA: hypothetical protein VNS34_00665 [Rhizobiaceae bacterium]|nr:hypothetical protein [Rhizobiaceae bacterium]
MLLTRLHAIAAPRGDGLRPELADMLGQFAATIDAGPKLVDLAAYRGESLVQSGPHPAPARHAALPDGVIPFPAGRRNK